MALPPLNTRSGVPSGFHRCALVSSLPLASTPFGAYDSESTVSNPS